jgi:hypothetical protein
MTKGTRSPGPSDIARSDVKVASVEVLSQEQNLLLKPEWLTTSQAQYVSGLGKSSIYNIVKDPANGVRTRAFCRSTDRRRKVRLINYSDLLAFISRLPEDLQRQRRSS